MDGAVVVEQRTGTLHATRSFSPRFDRRHAKSDRMNLGALLFALQNFANNAIVGDDNNDDDAPAIQLFETSTECIVMACSSSRGLLIALFMRPVIKPAVAKSLVKRIARQYDDCDCLGEQRVAASIQSARLLRQVTESAIHEEVSHLVRGLLTDLHQDPMRSSFVLLYYSPALTCRERDSDDGGEDEATGAAREAGGIMSGGVKESHVTPATTTTLQREATRSEQKPKTTKQLYMPSAITKKNAVMHHAAPRAYQCLETTTAQDAVGRAIQHQRFENALVDSLLPLLETDGMWPHANAPVTAPVATETTWRRFPLPDLTVVPTGHVVADVRIWGWKGCVLVHTDHQPEKAEPAHIEDTLHTVRHLARAMLSMSS